jgi:putative peptidoglycan lipid II flippase
MPRSHQLVRAGILVLFALGLNKITGFVKLLLTTTAFGAGSTADAFTAANQLPELFGAMLASGALSAAVIPVYAAYWVTGNERQARPFANTVVTLTILVMSGVGLIAGWLALPVTRTLLAPDFPPAQQVQTAELMQVLLIAMTLYGISSIFSSLLNVHQHFLTPALTGLFVDLGQIVGLIFLVPHWGILGLAWGSVLGTLAGWLIQIPPFLQRRIATRPQLAVRQASVGEVLRLMGPRIITMGAMQAVDLLLIRLASPLTAGSISAFFYAHLIIVSMPKTLFTLAITTVIFPTLAEQHHHGEAQAVRTTVRQALVIAWALIIPGAVGLVALGEPAVAFLLQRGAFDATATRLVYTLLAIFALRLIVETAQEILVLPFYTRHDTRTPMWIYLGWMVLNGALYYLFVGPWGIYGLAWAATAAAVVATLALYWYNQRTVTHLDTGALLRHTGRILLATAGMTTVIWVIRQVGLPLLPYLISAITGGGLVYGLLYSLLGGRELLFLLDLLPGRAEVARAP